MSAYPKKILLATDGSEDSIRAARVAVALAGNAELHVVHVGQPATSEVGASAARPPLPGAPPGYAEKEARRLLDGQVKTIEAAGGNVAEAHVRMGEPAAEVVALGAGIGADMVVVGSGGPHAVRRAVAATTRRPVLGRASNIIVRSAPCPVLVVRGEVETEDRAQEEAGDPK